MVLREIGDFNNVIALQGIRKLIQPADLARVIDPSIWKSISIGFILKFDKTKIRSESS